MFFALLRKGINEELPGWPEIVVVFDGQNGSAQRKETDSGYEVNRPADDQALKPIRAVTHPDGTRPVPLHCHYTASR
jgi:DNA polymerase-1